VTRLLVSVRSAAEAQFALAGGADVIDVKEPRRGSLGRASPEVWTDVAQAIAGARPLSAALGELSDLGQPEAPARDFPRWRSGLSGYSFAKLGLSRCAAMPDWINRWQAALAALPGETLPVAVAYADHRAAESPSPSEVCAVGQRLGCAALLVDTYDKTRGDVFDVIDFDVLSSVFQQAWQSGMTTVLAGSLRLERLEKALSLQPDLIAVRGAVCRESRQGELDVSLVKTWANACPRPLTSAFCLLTSPPASAPVDRPGRGLLPCRD